MEKKQIILPTKKFFKAKEEDVSVRINLDESKNLLREGDKDIVLNIAELFNDERQSSPNYKIYGKLRMIFRNMYSGTTNYPPLSRNIYCLGDGTTATGYDGYLPYDEFAFLRKDVIRELNLPNSGSTLGTFTENIILSGYTGHTVISSIEAPYHNWNLYLSYVYSADTTTPMKYTLSGGTVASFRAGDGIPFQIINNGNQYKFVSPVDHGMVAGEYITISGGSYSNIVPLSGRTFQVDSVGDETYDSQKYVVNMFKSQFPTGATLSTLMMGKRCVDKNNITGTTSQYYVHKHKTLTDESGYILDVAGFETPIWEDERKLLFENSEGTNDFLVERNKMESVLFDFKDPLVLTGITNNLGYTPTDVYVTTIFRNGNGYFNYPPKFGWEFNFHDSWNDKYFSGTTSNETGLTGNTFIKIVTTGATGGTGTFTFVSGATLPKGTILNGAFVEYNDHEFKERIISECFHKLTHPDNSSGNIGYEFAHGQSNGMVYPFSSADNPYGLFYQPHYRLKVRQLSPYVETYNTNDIYGLPENAKFDLNESQWKWRDLYDHGYIDTDGYGTNFPFLNNNHYVTTNIDFFLRNEKAYTNKNNGIIKFKNVKLDC